MIKFLEKNTKGVMVIVFVVIGLVCVFTNAWNWAEPIIGFATLGLTAGTWFQTRRAVKAVYADNGDGSWVVALEVGRPVSEAVKKQFGQMDCLVTSQVVLGSNLLALPEHYETLAKAVYIALCQGQNKSIHLCLSGPVALAAIIGQMIGVMNFKVTVYQFSPSSGSYEPVPRPTMSWLEHRGVGII